MARRARYDARKDPDWWWRTQRAPGRPGVYVYKVCTVCGGRYRPLTYGTHKDTPAHRARLR